ncbi:MAG: hypothetical protein ACKOTB_05890, partial [Planctomycetia bacterium]
DLGLMFAADGMFPRAVLSAYFDDPWAWSLATAVDASWWGAVMLGVEGVAGCLLAAGCFTRGATVVAWIAVVSILRRTAPATNAGDAWLACLRFWGMFLPLGAVWSWDRRRESASDPPAGISDHAWFVPGGRGRVCSVATAALVLQIAAVYLAAGQAKWSDCGLCGDAIRHELSVPDHGSSLGHALLAGGAASRPLSWAVMGLELAGPILLVAFPAARVRGILVAAFMMFHACCCVLLSVGLFGFIGLAAWLAIVPAEFWDRTTGRRESAHAQTLAHRATLWIGSRTSDILCATAGAVALVSRVHDATPWRHQPLPAAIAHALNLVSLHQEWGMFGSVERQEQWVVGRAELADTSVVDLLRGGRSCADERPAGGCTALPPHRGLKRVWQLPRPRPRMVAAPLAAALVRDWNARHPASKQVVTFEIRFARLGRASDDDTLHELLLAAWPPRDADGSGGLDGLLVADDRGGTR